MFGKLMSERWGKVHFWLTFLFYNCTFFPMHILGMAGEMRRIYDPSQYTFLQPYQPMRVFITVSAYLLFATQLIFFVNFWWSLFKGKKAPQNPWEDNGLEWSLPAPAPHGNWETVPTVYRGPYEFSSPQVPEDYLPQYRKLPTDRDPARAPVAGGLKFWMLATIIGGAMFVGVQAYEYTRLVHHGFLPSGAREGSEVAELVASGVVPAATIGLYGSTFYTMTGFHGFHVTCGVISMTYLYVTKALRGKYSRYDYRGVEVIGLYWHFVDLVWIILFTIVYLI